jgi:hypothetical protein
MSTEAEELHRIISASVRDMLARSHTPPTEAAARLEWERARTAYGDAQPGHARGPAVPVFRRTHQEGGPRVPRRTSMLAQGLPRPVEPDPAGAPGR